MALQSSPCIMDSCKVCLDFFNIAYNRARDFFASDYMACNLDQRRRIKESAAKEDQGCQLCGKIFKFLEQHYGPECGDQHAEDEKFQVFLHGSLFESDRRGDKYERYFSLFSFDWDPWTLGNQATWFSIWADEDGFSTIDSRSGSVGMNEPSRELVDWAPILSNSPAEISGYVRRLLANCLDHHLSCGLEGKTPEEEGLREPCELPSRVLSIEDNAGNISVKLLETHGLIGTYCALSHCWGPKEKPPLQTTRKTFKDHLSSIPFDALSKTFQDAVVLMKNLGIQYLWIDSLCIVQGDEHDWKMEAKKMASIYQNAILVIAAADSKDSSSGFLEADRPELLVFNCPITSRNGIMTNYRIAAARGAGWGMGGPLRERGWAFQEWYLGRRKVFFTSQGLRWKCKEDQLDERGSEVELEMYAANSWLLCLNEYSGKKLTFEKDRIVALLGIVADLKKSRNDAFREDVGVWEDELAEQLLWRQLEVPRKQEGPRLPSWSWAATVGKKAWSFYFPYETRLKAALNDTPQTVRLSQSVSVSDSGHLIRVRTEPSRLEQCCIESLEAAFHTDESFMLPDDQNFPESDDIARYPVLDVDGNSILGLAIFDNGLHFSTCCCFILGSTKGIYHPSWGSTCHDICRNYLFERPPEDRRKNYWALLLQPVDGKYKRVGIALLWQEAMEKMESEILDFEIV